MDIKDEKDIELRKNLLKKSGAYRTQSGRSQYRTGSSKLATSDRYMAESDDTSQDLGHGRSGSVNQVFTSEFIRMFANKLEAKVKTEITDEAIKTDIVVRSLSQSDERAVSAN